MTRTFFLRSFPNTTEQPRTWKLVTPRDRALETIHKRYMPTITKPMRNTKDTANDPTNKVNMVKENSPRRRKETVNSSPSMQVNQEPSIPTTKTTHDLEPARKITQTNQRTLMRRQCPPSKHRLNCNHLLK